MSGATQSSFGIVLWLLAFLWVPSLHFLQHWDELSAWTLMDIVFPSLFKGTHCMSLKSPKVSDCSFYFLLLENLRVKVVQEGDPFNFNVQSLGTVCPIHIRAYLYLHTFHNREFIAPNVLSHIFRHIGLIEYVYLTSIHWPCLLPWGFMEYIQLTFHSSVLQTAVFEFLYYLHLQAGCLEQKLFFHVLSDHAQLSMSMITFPGRFATSSE